MKFDSKVNILVWMAIWLVMSCICHSAACYHFYYMEQWGTFYYDSAEAWQTLGEPGGITVLIAEFFQQFFCYGAGPLIFGAMMTVVAWAQGKMVKGSPRYLGCITAMTMLVSLTSNMGCLFSGSVSLVLVMLLFVVLLRANKIWKCLAVVLLLCIVRKNTLVRQGNEGTALAYLPWATAAVIFLIQIFIKYLLVYVNKHQLVASMSDRKKKVVGLSLQTFLVIGCSAMIFGCYYQAKDEYMKKIFYYVRHQQWDEIINRSNSRGSKGNVAFQLCRNMALAEKGELGEKFLMYDQSGGMKSVMTTDMNSLQVAMILTDVFYTMGYVNMSQLCAFESQECMDNKSPYLWQRLVDTNIENGAYAVAEKYIKKLERTLAYREWAKSRRKFLYNDRAVNHDSVLGLKRKCIFKEDCLIGQAGFDNDLARIVEACPEHRASLEYLGVMYIVANQKDKFMRLMNKYKGTKAMPQIPASFEKAMKVFESQTVDRVEPLM